MTLDDFFRIAEKNEQQATKELHGHLHLADAVEVAGDYQEGLSAPAIVHAAHRGLSKLVKALIEAGAYVGSKGLGGGTPLHFAAWTGNSETAKVLLQHNPPINLRCEAFGATPLGWAAHGFGPEGCYPKLDHIGTARLLLEAGADPEIQNRSGNRPIDLVKEPIDNPMRKLLESHGSFIIEPPIL